MKRKEDNPRIFLILLRYLCILLIAIPNIYIFYLIFTPLTIYPINSILSVFYPTHLNGTLLVVNNFPISIIPACIAGSAYYLLFLLNFSIPLPAKKRVYSLIFSLSSFLLLNILRISVFSVLLVNSFKYFDVTHKIFWYILSGIFVFLIWILTIKLFKIKEIPFYTDVKFIYKLTKRKKTR